MPNSTLQPTGRSVEADPLDQYAAFDFFVSASHMPDWLSPGIDAVSVDGRIAMRESNILLQICDHIATGFKHFEASPKRHYLRTHGLFARSCR